MPANALTVENMVQERLLSLETQQRSNAQQLNELQIISAKQTTLLENLTIRFDKQDTILERLQEMAARWHGIVMAALIGGPVLGALVGILVRLILFGRPLTEGTGLIK